VIPRWGEHYKEIQTQTPEGVFFVCPPSQFHAGSMNWSESQTKNPAEAGFVFEFLCSEIGNYLCDSALGGALQRKFPQRPAGSGAIFFAFQQSIKQAL
jgi:hypothetical protein